MSLKIYASQDWVEKEIKNSTADWNKNDPEGAGYIKNRPFYEKTGVTSIVLFDGDAQFAEDTPETVTGWYDEPKEFENGKTYTVTVENEQQDIVCENNELIFVSSELNMTFRLGEMDIYIENYDSWESSYHIKIETIEVSTTIKQLDEKYIPDTIARKEYVNEAIANLVDDTAVSEQISTAISESVADWNQNDETAADHIKNRTHYENIVETSVVLADEEVYLELLPDVSPSGPWSEPITLENGKTYTVIVNDVDYGTVCKQELVCENDELIFDSPEELYNTLTIKSKVIYGANEGTYHIKIETTEFSTAIKQLDEKFIPNTIARTSDIEAIKDHVDNSIIEAKSYTDTAVAALVNSAPETLDTLGELAAAFEENADMVATLDAAVTNKAEKTELESAQNLIEVNANNISSMQTALNKYSTETWTFTLDDGSTVTKKLVISS